MRAALTAVFAGLVLWAVVAAPAHAGYYKMVTCSGNAGAPPFTIQTNTVSSANPSGIFHIWNWCDGEGGDPPGEGAFFRIQEHQDPPNTAGETAYGNFYFDTPAYVHYKAAGGYTREPFQFNDGWRARFWVASACCTAQVMTQGAGLPNSGGQWAPTSSFGPHLWPFAELWDFTRFVFELMCVRPSRCDSSGTNAVDMNGMVFILSDDSDSQVSVIHDTPFLQERWTRGTQDVTFLVSDLGSGIRNERLQIDGNLRWALDHGPECNTSFSPANLEWSRVYQPCPVGGPWWRGIAIDTATLADGGHTVRVCTEDFGQYQGLYGTKGESCAETPVKTDNTAPGAPSGLFVNSANPQRYLSNFSANFSLPPNNGSPIAKVHYDVINAAGDVVVSEKTLAGTDPTELKEVEGPAQPGEYFLRVWLEDSVGFMGPAATTPIPHDTTPPAAPQDISVTVPSRSRTTDGFDVRWHNIVDAGAPVDAIHYQVLDAADRVAVPTQTVAGDNVQAIANLESPEDSGQFTLRMWLSDAEGNVGAPVSVPLAYQCVRAAVAGGETLTTGLGESASPSEVVEEGDGSTLRGSLSAANGNPVGMASVCVFSRVVTDQRVDFAGLAITGRDGVYRFPVSPGASRELSVVYRRDHRELVSHATIETIVHPVLKAKKNVVYNKHYAHFFGAIPGPNNDRVVIVLQARMGKGWTAFRRYRTRDDGKFSLDYRFRRTFRRMRYVMRAQVRQTVGYPYLQGNSRELMLTVLPKRQPRRGR